MIKVDLHTHSTASLEGGITADEYNKALFDGIVSCVAITDYKTVEFAQKLKGELKEMIIVGQEIMTSYGEMIGLFLKSTIPSNLEPIEAAKRIKAQGGLVYIPHPLNKQKHGMQIDVIDKLVDYIDIVEIGNGRSFLQYRYSQMLVWANINHKAVAASSDARNKWGLGRTLTLLSEVPTKDTLVKLLLNSVPVVKMPDIIELIYTRITRILNRYS
jgi:predicted metal-dependent phosphoesterase TrpH